MLAFSPDRTKIEEFRKKIIEWYEACGDKHLPWRNTKDGWAVLVAAFLLRKTTITQVAKIYEEFLKKFPDPQTLLLASESELRDLIKPLGIEHQRSKDLKKLAEELVKRFNGKVPCNKEELKKLPGVGEYIASEVLLRTCSQPEPLLDRNMIRVIERVFGVKSAKKRPHTDRALWLFAKTLVPRDPEEAEKFNFGILDFARKICKVKDPQCYKCPIEKFCQWFSKQKVKS
jgi:A/G-specific adenine glycosylase